MTNDLGMGDRVYDVFDIVVRIAVTAVFISCAIAAIVIVVHTVKNRNSRESIRHQIIQQAAYGMIPVNDAMLMLKLNDPKHDTLIFDTVEELQNDISKHSKDS